MNNKHLHIISFDNPYPPDYGGVIDVFYKIRALADLGIKVHLHCFIYGRTPQPELDQWCASVHYYQREKMWKGFFSDKPFIVQSRNAAALKRELLKDDHPILFEGLHTCYFLSDEQLIGRLKLVRMHNDEAKYYLHLARREKKIRQQLYFYAEYRRLIKYEQVLQFADRILCIAPMETDHYRKRFSKTLYLPPFHGNKAVTSQTGKGSYILYHGNLSVNENNEASIWLVENVFNSLSLPCIIAGNAPSDELMHAVAAYPHIQLIADPSADKMLDLIRNAHIHVLPAFQNTGIKLKLINALFNGRFCIVNPMMVDESGLGKYCRVAVTAMEMQATITALMELAFDDQALKERKVIADEFSDLVSAEQLISLLP